MLIKHPTSGHKVSTNFKALLSPVLVWLSQKQEPGKTTWVQVTYLGGDYWEQEGGGGQERAVESMRRLVRLDPTGGL